MLDNIQTIIFRIEEIKILSFIWGKWIKTALQQRQLKNYGYCFANTEYRIYWHWSLPCQDNELSLHLCDMVLKVLALLHLIDFPLWKNWTTLLVFYLSFFLTTERCKVKNLWQTCLCQKVCFYRHQVKEPLLCIPRRENHLLPSCDTQIIAHISAILYQKFSFS